MVGFQNCAKYDYQDLAANETLNKGLSSDEMPDNTTTPLDQTQPPQAGQPNPTLPTNPPRSLPPIMPYEDQECIDWAVQKKDKKHEKNHHDHDKDYKDDDEDSDDHGEKYAKGSSVDNNKNRDEDKCDKNEIEKQVAVKKPRCYVKDKDDNDDEDYESTCDIRNINKAKYLNSISSILNIFGLRGKFVISPDTVGSNSLSKIEDLRGKIIICHMDIDSIKNTRGKIIVYKSNIGLWQDHRGKSVIVDSRIDKCDDHKGKIDIKGSNAVCNNIQNSAGVVNVSRNGI
jgi:hypothetical protein